MNKYVKYVFNRKNLSGLLIMLGALFMLEHLFSYGGFDIEIVGHEFWGICLIVVGLLVAMKWKQLPQLLKAIKEGNIKGIFDSSSRKK